jgi:hypothetical protein
MAGPKCITRPERAGLSSNADDSIVRFLREVSVRGDLPDGLRARASCLLIRWPRATRPGAATAREIFEYIDCCTTTAGLPIVESARRAATSGEWEGVSTRYALAAYWLVRLAAAIVRRGRS